MTPENEKELEDFCNEIESLLKKQIILQSVNKTEHDNVFELFFKGEVHPIVTNFQINNNKSEGIGKYECMMKFKVIPSSQHHFNFAVLTAHNPQEMVKEVLKNYKNSMKSAISRVKQGFKRDTGINADDALTSQG